MLKYVVLGSDIHLRKGGLKQCPLYQFLRVYFSAREVCALRPDQLDPRRPISCEVVLIETPTSLDQERLRGLRYRQAVLYDYVDRWWLNQNTYNYPFLRSISDLYLKAHVDRTREYDIRMGTLPLYRKRKLRLGLQLEAWKRAVFRNGPERDIDLFFAGAPTRLMEARQSPIVYYDQRLEWLSEVMDASFPFQFAGGLTGKDSDLYRTVESIYGDLSHLLARGRFDFFSYFRHLCRAKVALVPSGFARWTFRHYEAAYAKVAMLSTDMTNIEMFVPLPPHMIHVPDRVPLLPYVQQAIDLWSDHQEQLQENVSFLEQYFEQARFSRNRPLALERFRDQLEPGYDARQPAPETTAEQFRKAG